MSTTPEDQAEFDAFMELYVEEEREREAEFDALVELYIEEEREARQ